MSPSAEAVVQRLDAARQKWWICSLLTTTVLVVCASFGLLLAMMLADSYMKFSQPALGVMCLVWLAVTAGLVLLLARRLMRSQRSLEATARRVESEYPELGSDLINLVQLSEDRAGGGRSFCRAAVNQAAARVGNARLDQAANRLSRGRRFVHCMQTPRDLGESLVVLAVVLAIALLLGRWISNFGSAAKRLFTPWEFVPSVGRVQITEVLPGDTEVMVGQGVTVTVEIVDHPEGEPYKAALLVTEQGEHERRRPMIPGQPYTVQLEESDGEPVRQTRRRYTATLSSIIKPLKYRAEVGDSGTRKYTVGVREKPTVAEVEVTYRYPAYLRRTPQTFTRPHADLQAPQFTRADLRIRPSVPIAAGHIQMGVGEPRIRRSKALSHRWAGAVQEDGRLLVVNDVPLLESGTCTVHLLNDAGHTDPNPRVNRVVVVPDRPPRAKLLKPQPNSSASPGSEVPVIIRAHDDHRVQRLRLEMKVTAPPGATDQAEGEAEASGPVEVLPVTTVREWTEFDADTPVEQACRLKLDREEIQPGRTVRLRAVAWDNRRLVEQGRPDLKPQQFAGPWHAIRIVTGQVQAAAELKRLEDLRGAIWKLLQQQIRARLHAALIPNQRRPDQCNRIVREVRTRQVTIQTSSVELVEKIGPQEPAGVSAIKRTLNELALGAMLEAVSRCDGLVRLTAPAEFARPTAELLDTQDRIIAALRRLLDLTRRAETELLSEFKERPAGDLPDDVRNKLEDLSSRLDRALTGQKKVIEAAERLAKAPVEDFSEDKAQLLEALAAAEDDWSKFVNELNTDLSKLSEQDFANPSLLKEAVEIQTEIKMADDALLKKTTEIAVPLEQLGAEMAEQIQTNLEKWLPDAPDREKWSQEESLSDEGKEAPMAELPGELEDLIGELMEEEEDLFDEMEDVSSSAADSIDKGAGWDVVDGPISNMSAKGATGNRLPNTSEIGGRSGEGRSGKSSGEFVGEQAVGKQGRRTPSRLTPDPYVAGRIKDQLRDPTGGATGGGKESGAGGEGLEGPLPGPKQRHLQRLAGRQAALRNKAEGIDLKFQVMNFHRADLKELIAIMAGIERDLKAGRYQNALRQRKVIARRLGDVKQYVEGKFVIRDDATGNLPAEIQKKMLGNMDDPSPAGWEELNRRYFQRLSAGSAAGDE